MKPVRVKLNRKSVKQILQSEDVRADLERRARAVATAAGGGEDYEVSSQVGANRARASVLTATYEARRAEAKDRTLSTALEAGRG